MNVTITLSPAEADALKTALAMASADFVMQATAPDVTPVVKRGSLALRDDLKSIAQKLLINTQSPAIPRTMGGAPAARTTLKQQVDFIRQLQADAASGLTTPSLVRELRRWLGRTGYESAYADQS